MTNTAPFSGLDPGRIARFFFSLFLITLFFPIRYVFPTASSFATGIYSDFTSIPLYLSDIFLFIAFIFIIWSNKQYLKSIVKSQLSIIIFFIWLILSFVWHIKSISGLNIWYFVKFLELIIVAYGTTRLVISNRLLVNRNLILIVFVSLGAIQSVIGLLQFINQSPIGLNLIGEQVIYPSLWGVAKIVSGGTTYIRAYGTFPHPNLLSAFLLTTVFINIYLLSSTTWPASAKASPSARATGDRSADQPLKNTWGLKIANIWLNLALFINILGLTATFSRGAFLALAVGLAVFYAILLHKGFFNNDSYRNSESGKAESPPKPRRRWRWSLVMVMVSIALSFLLFRPFLLTRTTISDQATVERKIYNQTALNIIKDKPIFGLGIGESVLHMQQYADRKLQPWQIQPIHNYFLLSAAELGIIGALFLIWIFVSHLKSLILNLKSNFNTYGLLLTCLLLMFLFLMLFDHYFYTLQQTQMLLWVLLGMATATQPIAD